MNRDKLKQSLLEERTKLEAELKTVGRKVPGNTGDWEPTSADMNVSNADRNEVADVMEEYEARTAVEVELEKRLSEVTIALKKMENENYGVCEIGGERIEEDRLSVNPAATTCKLHMNE